LSFSLPPYAVQRLIALMDSDDERVAAVACNSILHRAFGKPGLVTGEKDSLEARIAAMTRGTADAHAPFVGADAPILARAR